MDSEKNLKKNRIKKSSSINLIISVVVGLLLCVGIGFLYASINDTSQISVNKNNEKHEQKIIETNIIDWKQNSIESQRKVDDILLSKQNWKLSEQKNGEKHSNDIKGKTITWNQRELIVGVPKTINLKTAIKWFADEISPKKLYVLNKRERIFGAKIAYEVDVAMNNKINSKTLNCVTDKIIFHESIPVSENKKELLDKKSESSKKRGKRIISIIQKYDENNNSKANDTKVFPAVIRTEINEGALAIIIDDSGYSKEIIKDFVKLPINITFSVLPFLPESKSSLDIILNAKKEAILHLPMEPINKNLASFDKMVKVNMTKEECQDYVTEAIDSLPGVIGVNNHQGSKATSSKYTMNAVLEIIKLRNLFFVDSRTYSKSIAYQTAKKMGVKTAKNKMFLDNSSNLNDIKSQIQKALVFIKNGQDAIVICHARPNSYKALKELYPELKKENVRFKFVSEVVK